MINSFARLIFELKEKQQQWFRAQIIIQNNTIQKWKKKKNQIQRAKILTFMKTKNNKKSF